MAINYYTQECDYIFKGKAKTTAWIKQCLENECIKLGEVSYIFCDQQGHIEINRQYLGHDYYTDVITFDYSEQCYLRGGKETVRVVSGDIFIDHQTVALNAASYGATPEQEMKRVIIHGILHLCGYKDKSPEEEKLMREKENFYLEKLNNTK